ncbi:MAG TPA: hypothetical protein VKS99_15245, partial [Blastocatellia bacterium]|nr:hypothetical protein [Blastocatellia bacterium]
GLVQDEVYTFTNVAGISGLVDNLLTNLRMSEEFRSAYEDVLSDEAGDGVADHLLGAGHDSATIETPAVETRPMRSPERIQRSK